MAISSYSTTPANNNSAAPNGAPEGMLPGDVNNVIRQNMADIRSWYQAAAWIDLGDTPTYASTTTFTVPGDQTAFYTVNRRIRCTDATTLYGYISSSVYVASTTVTVVLDSGSLSASLTAVAVSLIDPANYPIAAEGISGAIGSSTTIDSVVIGGTTPAAGSFTTGSFSSAVTSTKSADSGYTRINPNYCRATTFTDIAGGGGSTRGANGDFIVAAPASANYVEIAFVLPGGTIKTYSDAARTNIFDEAFMVSSTNGIFKVIAPSVSGTCYLNLSNYSATVYYDISGYYD